MSRIFKYYISTFLILLILLCQCTSEHVSNQGLPEVVDFNYHIRPILSQNCYTCHGPDESSRKAGLRLDNYKGATAKLESGERAIIAGRPGKGSIMNRITTEDEDLIMPPPETKKKLTLHEIQLIEKWIDQGANWKKHWAFISPKETKLPFSTIDEYIDKRQIEMSLVKGDEADKSTLIRRVSYILTGLPPSVEELKRFQKAEYEEIVDYYLSSKHFGEHWARHWMDLVRYAEGMGHEFDFLIGGAAHYRDYLIRAFNQDVPYDQLVIEHLAGDLIQTQRIDSVLGINESVIGTAYAFLGEGKHSPVDIKQEEADRMDNLIDVTSKTFQGLTVSCARCHDHKFDPIPTKDYYAMYGMFESSRITPVSFEIPKEFNEVESEILAVNDELRNTIENYIESIDLKPKAERINVIGDFQQNEFVDWYPHGTAFGDRPLYGKYASSRYNGRGISGSLHSSNFTIQDSFVYVIARGLSSSIRIIVDNFQLIQNPLYGGFSTHVNHEDWKLYRLNVSNVPGHKGYVELMPGSYHKHSYRIDSSAYLEVAQVFSSDQKIDWEIDSSYNQQIDQVELLRAEKDNLAAKGFTNNYVMGMVEGEAVFSPVFIRGSHAEPSEELVEHRFLDAVNSKVEFEQSGSGRLEWAQAVVDEKNPLTSRVMVNRIWHHIFGRGIVESVDNFGLQGSLPTHPELLDYLAVEFMSNDWSIKKMIKQVMMSETFKTATEVNETNAKLDPQNKYLASFPVRRLEAESIRDAILAVSGSLKKELYGASVPLHLTEFMTGRGRPESGPLDGNGRRSIYLAIKRNFLSPMLLTFDMPIPFSTFGKRNNTNVPAQSLFLMNDEFVHEQSGKWAKKICYGGKSTEEKIETLYLQAFSRLPNQEEKKQGKQILDDLASTAENELEAWKNYCHIILNTKEFIYLL